jgi:hypothetical protein
MNRLLVLALFALGFLPSVSSAVDIKNIRPCYAPFGATRLDSNCLPGDTLFITFDIEGLAIDPKTGKANYDTVLELLDADKKVLFKNTSMNEVRPQLGGTRMPGQLDLFTGVKRPPGRYTVKLSVYDKVGKDGKAFNYAFVVVPEAFGFIGVSAPAIGFYGQQYATGFAIVNMALDAKKKEPNVDVKFRILDDTGKEVAPPVQMAAPRDLPENIELQKLNLWPVSFPVYLNRVGRFTIEIEATDKIAGKNAKLSFKMTVLDINNFTGK